MASKYKMNAKQIAFRDWYVNNYAVQRKAAPDTSHVCHNCEDSGDCRDPQGIFSVFIPAIEPGNPKRGLKMDDMRGIWYCPKCAMRKLQGG